MTGVTCEVSFCYRRRTIRKDAALFCYCWNWLPLPIIKGGQATQQILGLIPQLQIRKFMRCDSPHIANPQFLFIYPPITNLQISTIHIYFSLYGRLSFRLNSTLSKKHGLLVLFSLYARYQATDLSISGQRVIMYVSNDRFDFQCYFLFSGKRYLYCRNIVQFWLRNIVMAMRSQWELQQIMQI